ncbi:thiol-specific monooxygenase [Massarina eburnea CBS 473.64]|uniref:Thiol-specific monooxygenase n=1 Tax=Massarina eburnea CBS 473.64 TaxID=1395130 RepID=A0A6A6RSM5_9PLEO|nr:thiol-specific monooxygenase [Massarina eburnea CBS 473.64]
MEPILHVKNVAVIGAGPAGLAAIKYLKAENYFDRIVAFDQRDEVGGVWNYTGAVSESNQPDFTIPRTKPAGVVERPSTTISATGEEKRVFTSPIYDSLETNIPHTLMNYSDKKFPQDCPLFPPFAVVKQYLEEYASEIKEFLKLGTQIIEVQPIQEEGEKVTRWKVTYIDLATSIRSTEIFDAIVCASGHYSDPFIPHIPGISEFNDNHPNVISHSKYYRKPEEFANKRVIVIGHSASGIDISSQISAVAAHVIISEKEKPAAIHMETDSITYRPEISEFIHENRTVRFVDGHIESDIDSIIFCTGYQYSFPFLKGLNPPAITTGERTKYTYQQIFYFPQPTITFLTLPQRIIPFPVAEAQSAYIARVFSGRLTLPTFADMQAWEDGVVAEKGDGKFYHNLQFPQDAAYINMLHEISMSAEVIESRGLVNRGHGKIPPFWDEEARWTRQRFPMIKQAALNLGEERRNVRCLRDLGFDFETWKQEQQVEKEPSTPLALSKDDSTIHVRTEIMISDDAA